MILAAAVVAGCQKKENPKSLSELICNEWKLTSPVEANIYLSFTTDGKFEEYQRLDNGKFELRRGTWTLSGNILSGKYNDDQAWSATYAAAMSDKFLTLTSQEEDGIEYQYVNCQIPDVVREAASVVVKSSLRILNSQPQYSWL